MVLKKTDAKDMKPLAPLTDPHKQILNKISRF
jgi:hypothetical protein